MDSMSVRIGRDSLGEVRIPADALYGPQTQRAVENFPVSGLRLPRAFIRAQGLIKASAAHANMTCGQLDERKARAIIQAAEEVIEGKWDGQFVVDAFQAGAGTSQNMNANEVIANRATQLLGGQIDQMLVHPNDDVNMAQSTNDTIHVAINISRCRAGPARALACVGPYGKSAVGKVRAVYGDHQGRAHTFAGCRPDSHGTGIFRLRAKLCKCT